MKFRKKPVTVEATQWFANGDHPLDYSKNHDGYENGELKIFTAAKREAEQWEGDIVRYYRTPKIDGYTKCKHCNDIMHNHGWIETLEGGHIVCPGDWIITGVHGEHYPCKDSIFKITYELVSDTDAEIIKKNKPEIEKCNAHIAKLETTISDQLRTIIALNDCIGGKGTCTTDNLVHVGRLEEQIAKLEKENGELRAQNWGKLND